MSDKSDYPETEYGTISVPDGHIAIVYLEEQQAFAWIDEDKNVIVALDQDQAREFVDFFLAVTHSLN